MRSPETSTALGVKRERRLILLLGMPRCGTTLLARALDAAGVAALTDPKETHYLARHVMPASHTGPGDSETIDRERIVEAAAWERAVENARARSSSGWIVEASASTAYYVSESGGRVLLDVSNFADVIPVLILRRPLDRALSAHQYLCNRGHETLGFDEALDVEAHRVDAGYQHLWHYQAQSNYEPILEAVSAEFNGVPLIFGFEEVSGQLNSVVRKIAAYAGDLPANAVAMNHPINGSGRIRSQRAYRALQGLKSTAPMSAARRVIPTSFQEGVRRALIDVGHQPRASPQGIGRFKASDRTYERIVGSI